MSGRFEHSDKDTLSSKPADSTDSAVTRVRRIELITGTGQRRRWSADDSFKNASLEMIPKALREFDLAMNGPEHLQQMFDQDLTRMASFID
jgi:hypothetical protein